MEKKHDLNCADCENETRTFIELKTQAIEHCKNTKKCQKCNKEKPAFLKVSYKTIPFADKIDKDYTIFHYLVVASKNLWNNSKEVTPYCYDCYEKEKEKIKSLPDKGEYVEFLAEF